MTIGIVAALLSSLSWATTTVMMRSQSGRMDPISLNTFRSLAAAAFFLVMAVAFNKLPAFATLTPLSFAALCGSLLFGFILGDTLFFRAMTLVGVSIALPISMTFPLYVLVIAWALLGETVGIFTVIGTLLVVTGTITIATGGLPQQSVSRREWRLGIGLAVGSALCFAISTSILKVGVLDVDAFVANAVRLGITTLVLLVWRAAVMDAPPFRTYGRRALLVLSLAAILGTGAGSLAYLVAVQQAGAALTATLSTTAPLFATPISVVFLREKLTPQNVVGMLLCVAGVWIVVPR